MDLVFGLANRGTKMYDGNIGTPYPLPEVCVGADSRVGLGSDTQMKEHTVYMTPNSHRYSEVAKKGTK
jgi:hypothetical protein